MIFYTYISILSVFVFHFVLLVTGRIDPNNVKREAPINNVIVDDEVFETHKAHIVPNFPLQKNVFLPPRFPPGPPPPLRFDGLGNCNLWCRLRIFLDERNQIIGEYFARERIVKDLYQSKKIPGLFVYNNLLKQQKTIATQTNQLQKSTELTAHYYRPLFDLLRMILPLFGPNLSPVLTRHLEPLEGPEPVLTPTGPPPQPFLIPKGHIPSLILGPRGFSPTPQPILIPKGPNPAPQSILIPNPTHLSFVNGPTPHPVFGPSDARQEIHPGLGPQGPIPSQLLLPLGPTPLPPQNLPLAQPLIDIHEETVTQIERTKIPLPAPPIPSPQIRTSSTPLPIPQPPFLSILPPPPPAHVGNEIITHSEVNIVTPVPFFVHTPIPSPMSRGESGIVTSDAIVIPVPSTPTPQLNKFNN